MVVVASGYRPTYPVVDIKLPEVRCVSGVFKGPCMKLEGCESGGLGGHLLLAHLPSRGGQAARDFPCTHVFKPVH